MAILIPIFIAAPVVTVLVVTAVTYYAVKQVQAQRKMKKQMEAAMSATTSNDFAVQGAQGIMVNKTGSSQKIPVIYGKTRTGGIRVFAETEGTDNVHLHMAFVIGEGEMNKCSKIYFDGVEAATCSTAGATDTGSWSYNSPWSGKVQMSFRPGTDGQSAIGDLTSKASWTDPRFRGIAYAYIRLEYDEEVWTNGVPTITFEVEGVKVPSTSDGTSLSYTNGDNPANCILGYLTNTRYGKGIAPADLDLASFETARAYCNGRFHTRGNLSTDAPLYSNIQDLLTSCRGYLTFGNKYKLIIDKASSETPFAITKDNIIGDITYTLGGKESLFNRMTANYLNESKEYKDDVKVKESSTLKTQDNGVLLEASFPLPFTKTESVVNQMLIEEINQSRQSHSISLKCTVDAIDLQVGDLVNVTNETFGITEKTFRVMSTVIETSSEISLSLLEYDNDVYGTSIITDARADDND